MKPDKARIGVVWSQFAEYHCDRCDAIGERLGGRYDVLAVEVASHSKLYAWPESRALAFARKHTLFPGVELETISFLRRTAALVRALWRCRTVFFGLPYNEAHVIAASWLLRICGTRVIMMTDSKYDDAQRNAVIEVIKRLILSPYSAAIVSGARSLRYVRSLGFRREAIVPGYDVISCARFRRPAVEDGQAAILPYAERPFIYVGRFVPKKNLPALVRAYAGYVAQTTGPVRRLQLIGSGALEGEIRALVDALGIAALVDFPGFLGSEEIARRMKGALSLVLVSQVEQWGLVVNEAASVGLPAIISCAVGAGDALVRNFVNGFVVEASNVEGLTCAMRAMAEDEAAWREMAAQALRRASLGDVARLADAVEFLLEPASPGVRERIEQYLAETVGQCDEEEDATLRSAARKVTGRLHRNT